MAQPITSSGVWSNLPSFTPPSAVPHNTSSAPITQVAQNVLCNTPISEGHARNNSKRLRNADKIFLSEEPELWLERSMPSESKLVKLIFDWSTNDLSEFDSLFPINENSDAEKLSLLNAKIKEICEAVDRDEFTVTHKHIFYLYQLFVKVTSKGILNKELNDIIGLISNSFFAAACSLLEKLSEIYFVGTKTKVKNLDELALLVRYANILSWPNEDYSDYLRSLIQAYVFKIEIPGSDLNHAETWRSVGYVLDNVIEKSNQLLAVAELCHQPLSDKVCKGLLNTAAGIEYTQLKNAVERLPRHQQTTHYRGLDHSIIIDSLKSVKFLCSTWKNSLISGKEIQLPMLYHGCKRSPTFLKEIYETHIKDFGDQSKTVYTGAFLSTWPESLFGPPAASFSNLQLFRAPSDILAKFDPWSDSRVGLSATLEHTRWISFEKVIPVSLHEIDGSKSAKKTIHTFGVKEEHIVQQRFETNAQPTISFEAQKTLAFLLRSFPFFLPRYYPGEHQNFIRPHLQHLYQQRARVVLPPHPPLTSSFSSTSSSLSTTSITTTVSGTVNTVKRRKK